MSNDILVKSNELASGRKPFAFATVVRVEGSSSAKPDANAIIDQVATQETSAKVISQRDPD
jgi:xanthine/CO dehydrogenase XdhC/CoxF family maturation factor